MPKLVLVYDQVTDPHEEDVALIRAVLPEAVLSHPGCFAIEGDFDDVEKRLGTIEGWTLGREGHFTIS